MSKQCIEYLKLIFKISKKKSQKFRVWIARFWVGGHVDLARVVCQLRALSSYFAPGIFSIRLFVYPFIIKW